jgi:hypothetical protein
MQQQYIGTRNAIVQRRISVEGVGSWSLTEGMVWRIFCTNIPLEYALARFAGERSYEVLLDAIFLAVKPMI